MNGFFQWIWGNPGEFIIVLDLLAFIALRAFLPPYYSPLDSARVGPVDMILMSIKELLGVYVPMVVAGFGASIVLGFFFDVGALLHFGLSWAFGISAVYILRPWNWLWQR